MGTILKGVHRVPWHELEHAYGSAEEVPGRLSRVAWGDARTSGDALSDLGLWLGELAVFDATVAAVPFLWDLAVTDSVTCRAEVIELLQAVLEHGNAPQIEVQHAAHLAVLRGRSLVDVLSGDEDPAVRAAAIDLAGAIDGHACGTCRPRRAPAPCPPAGPRTPPSG
ncbi:hypothetical protein GCM10011583_61430 [Streptomyces camponoticapitis]|uniref:HEAT repeat domain-containing protein n=1 Tax=Streptomyces camponoticapitis TaxID=1616125 RepID=A0ABQ2EQ83_9ACTN|nr:hypothetical protein GCM10011583_61430 [Streptomyces camponoticapitis]